jgi:hypothetical protein
MVNFLRNAASGTRIREFERGTANANREPTLNAEP